LCSLVVFFPEQFDIFASCRPKAEEELEVLQEEMQVTTMNLRFSLKFM